MVTEGMWNAIHFFTKLFPPNILKYNPTTMQLCRINKRKHILWLNFYILYSLPYLLGVMLSHSYKIIYTGVKESTYAMHVVGVCLLVCIVCLYMICFHTMIGNDGAFVQIYSNVSLTLQKFPGNVNSIEFNGISEFEACFIVNFTDIQQKNNCHPQEKFVKYLLIYSPANVIMTLVLCSGFILLDVDLLYLLINYFYPVRSVTLNVIISIPRYIHVASVSYLMFVFIIGTLEFVLFELYSASYSFYHFNQFVDSRLQSEGSGGNVECCRKRKFVRY